MKAPRRIILAPHPGKEHALRLAEQLRGFFEQHDIEVVATGEPADLAISIGGDGNIMRMVSEFSLRSIPTVGINAGDVGFLTSADSKRWEWAAERIIAGKLFLESRIMLAQYTGRKIRSRGSITDLAYDNDIVFKHPSSTAEFEVGLNGRRLYRFAGDGLAIATPSGSTAYNLSAGGSIIDPKVECIAIAPICSTFRNALPLVVAADTRIEVRLLSSRGGMPVSIHGDGKFIGNYAEPVHIIRHPIPALFAMLSRDSYLRPMHRHKGLKD
jgi:NAD+ kinase